jgi:hypothetical protein
MADERPSVIPTAEQMAAANVTGDEIATQHTNEIQETSNSNQLKVEPNIGEQAAADAMALKTAQQIAERKRLMAEQVARAEKLDADRLGYMNQKPPVSPPPTPPTPLPPAPSNQPAPQEVDKLASLSEPQISASFDVIPLPSEGKLYPSKKRAIKVAYLTAADENILSNPNLMESGKFLEILINRKVLEPDLRYSNLHVGDRNAILIWLRATGFGHEYPIQVFDPVTAEPFEHIVDLSKIKTIPLGAEPDKEGYFDYTTPISGIPIKFKLLTNSDVDGIESHTEEIKTTLGPEFIESVTYTLEKQIVEVDGDRTIGTIKSFVQAMRAGDSRGLRKYIDKIESGVDMSLEIRTPGGESLNTFLPFNLEFFWPKL